MPILTGWIMNALGAVIPWVLGVGFLASVLFGAYEKGRMDRGAEDKSAALQASLEVLKASAATAERLLNASNARVVQLEADASSLKDQVDAYAADIAKHPDAGCVLSPDDVRRLRALTPGAVRPGTDPSHAEPAR